MTPQQSFILRPATPEDWIALSPLLRAMGQVDDEIKACTRLASVLGRPDHALFVATTAGEPVVVGYAWVQDYGPHLRTGKSVARLHDLYVDPRYRRCGAGTLLLAEVQQWARDREVTWLQWQASASALPFYARVGLIGEPCPDPEHPFFEIDLTLSGV